METMNNLSEKFNMLEQKISSLIEIVKLEKERNLNLLNENKELLGKLETIEMKLLRESDEVNQDRELTKMAIDELIEGINSVFVQQDQDHRNIKSTEETI